MALCVVVACASAVGGGLAGTSAPPDPAAASPLPNGESGCEIVEPPQGLLSLREGMVVGAVSFRCAAGYSPADVRISLEFHDPYGFGWSIVLDQATAKLSGGVYQAATACRPGIWALIPSFGTLPAGGGAEYLVMLGAPLIVTTEDCELV